MYIRSLLYKFKYMRLRKRKLFLNSHDTHAEKCFLYACMWFLCVQRFFFVIIWHRIGPTYIIYNTVNSTPWHKNIQYFLRAYAFIRGKQTLHTRERNNVFVSCSKWRHELSFTRSRTIHIYNSNIYATYTVLFTSYMYVYMNNMFTEFS